MTAVSYTHLDVYKRQDLGYTRTTMAANKGKQDCEVERNPKSGPSSDCRMQPACMKSELLVDVYKRQGYSGAFARSGLFCTSVITEIP